MHTRTTLALRGRQAEAAELAEDHRLAAVAWTLEEHPSPTRAPVADRAVDRLGVAVALGQQLTMGGVVVDPEEVAAGVLPAVVGDDRPRRVERLGQVVERGGVVAVGRGVRDRRDTPALVEGHPRHDARVAAVAPDRLGPLLDDAQHRGRVERVCAGHLGPDQQPEPVAPGQEAGVLDLLVDADSVEPQRLHRFDLGAQRLVVGSGEM